MWTSLRVPASSANLGPGFDALGLALGIYLQCRFRPSDTLSITVEGRDAYAVATGVRMPIPPINLFIRNEIPLGKGLGSSAAALTAGVIIADRLLDLRW